VRPGICLSLEGETGLLDACMKDRLSYSVVNELPNEASLPTVG
jgi:hypothetical protein